MIETIARFLNWSPVKIAASVVVALLGIYGTFFYERKAEISLEILSNSGVLDVRESLSKLVIIYAGTNLKEQNQSLYLVTVRVANSGNADVIKSSFDEADPLGFRVSSGTILELPTIVAEDYLKNNLKPSVRDGNTVTFSPVILNAGDAFEAKTLVLVKNGELPKISAVGKLAGIRAIRVTEAYRESSNRTYLKDVFSGNIFIQLGRLGGYFIFGLIVIISLIVVIAIPSTYLSEKYRKYKRRKRVEDYRSKLNRKMSLKEEYLASNYIDNTRVFRRFKNLISPSVLPEPADILATIDQSGNHILIKENFEEDYKELENAGLILRDGPQISIIQDIEAPAKEFISFVAK